MWRQGGHARNKLTCPQVMQTVENGQEQSVAVSWYVDEKILIHGKISRT
jgi:hypothetical protein